MHEGLDGLQDIVTRGHNGFLLPELSHLLHRPCPGVGMLHIELLADRGVLNGGVVHGGQRRHLARAGLPRNNQVAVIVVLCAQPGGGEEAHHQGSGREKGAQPMTMHTRAEQGGTTRDPQLTSSVSCTSRGVHISIRVAVGVFVAHGANILQGARRAHQSGQTAYKPVGALHRPVRSQHRTPVQNSERLEQCPRQ